MTITYCKNIHDLAFKDHYLKPNFSRILLDKLTAQQFETGLQDTYFVYQYDLLKQILKHPNFTSRQIGYGNYKKLIALYPFSEIELKGDVLFSDFEQHCKLRSILLKSYRQMFTHVPVLIKEVIAEHFYNEQKLCIGYGISTPISEKIFLALAGIGKINEYAQYQKFFTSIRVILNAIDNNFEDCSKNALVEHWKYLFALVIAKIKNPNTSYPNLIYGLNETAEISIEEKAIMVLAFTRAGIENPRSFIVSAIIRLFQYPRLYKENKRMFMDEIMRYDCPAKITARHVSEDTKIGEHIFKKDKKIWLSFRTANFDNSVFEQPFEFQLRKTNPYLSLGVGAHYCMGKELTFNLSIAILDYIISKNYHLEQQLDDYKLDDSPVFRRYVEPIFITR